MISEPRAIERSVDNEPSKQVRLKLRHRLWMLAALTLLGLASCSTTSKLGENEQLYTGVKKLNYHQDSVKIESGVKDQIFEAINVKPNNPLYSPYYRTPFPIGLWVYNHWDSNSKGFKGWLYKHLVARPVTIRRVNPQTRTDMINTLLQNNGYFTSRATYQLNTSKKNPKKASITYDIYVAEPYRIGKVGYIGGTTEQAMLIDSLARANTYFRTGSRYCLDSLNTVRIDITNELRNRGYYYFRPEYIQYLADSVQQQGVIDIKMVKAPDIPNQAEERYLTGKITATVEGYNGGGEPDTVELRRLTLVRKDPIRLKNKVMSQSVRARPGSPFRVGSMDRTQVALSQLGIFSDIDMEVQPQDTILPNGDRLLDLDIFCRLDKPWEVKFEVQGTSKSNSFLGPALQLGLGHKNVFGGAERLNVNLTAAYEWQTGRGGGYKNNDVNSYEFGIETSLAIPRLLAPRFVDRSRRYTNWTRFDIKASIMNRPSFFKMFQLSAGMTWEWHSTRKSLHELTPFELTYNKLLSRTAVFDSVMMVNPAIAMSFADVFIPKMQYAYTYDTDFGANHITWRSVVSEAGHILSGFYCLIGKRNKQEMIGTPFSRFVKAETQLVWTRKFTEKSKLVGRVYLGAAWSTHDSLDVPYREQFYIGGANSVRAFAVRAVGPGSYHPAERSVEDYYDQTGTFKFETNWEWRFPLFGYFNGAVFLDAGNIWLLKEDEYDREFRPGGKLRMKNFFDELAVGTGLGIRFDMEMLVVRADLGIGLHAPYKTSNSGWYNIPRFKDGLAFHLAIGYPF